MTENYQNLIKFIQSMYQDYTVEDQCRIIESLVKQHVYTQVRNDERWEHIDKFKENAEDLIRDNAVRMRCELAHDHIAVVENFKPYYAGVPWTKSLLSEEDTEYLPTCETAEHPGMFFCDEKQMQKSIGEIHDPVWDGVIFDDVDPVRPKFKPGDRVRIVRKIDSDGFYWKWLDYGPEYFNNRIFKYIAHPKGSLWILWDDIDQEVCPIDDSCLELVTDEKICPRCGKLLNNFGNCNTKGCVNYEIPF